MKIENNAILCDFKSKNEWKRLKISPKYHSTLCEIDDYIQNSSEWSVSISDECQCQMKPHWNGKK